MNDKQHTRSLRWLPFLIAAVAAFLGMHLFFVSNGHNLLWECVYGIGYFLSGLVFHLYVLNRSIGVIGFLVWPAIATSLVFILVRLVIRRSLLCILLTAGAFLASFVIWIDDAQANALVDRGLPIFYNCYATNF